MIIDSCTYLGHVFVIIPASNCWVLANTAIRTSGLGTEKHIFLGLSGPTYLGRLRRRFELHNPIMTEMFDRTYIINQPFLGILSKLSEYPT